ncbi:MAG: bacillolysin, partial [Thermoleophilia bacterium]|nr:bacillolysin [Thermoleophilia bacterium]
MHISHTHRAPAPPPSSLPDFAAQARTQRRAELLVDDVRGFFSGLGVEAHEGNDAAAGVVVDASYDNAAYVTTGSGPGYLHIGHDAEADRSFTAAPDVIAHEWAHRIVDTITGRTLSSDDYHPDAAVGESLADTFAAIYDGDDWTIGEDIGKPVRDMANPGALGHPGSVADNVPQAQHTDLPVQV